MFIEPSTAISVGTTLLENRQKLLPLLRKLKFWILQGRLRVPIFGPGGAGKSTLALLLSGGLISNASYKESESIEEEKLKGDLLCTLIAVPGQERREHTWTKFYQELSAGKSAGIINVVSWGYHSFEAIGYKETKYFAPGSTKAKFLLTYLNDRRDREQTIIEKLVPRILDAKGKLWMITLVTKQDIWWPQRGKVRKHYMESAYNDCINQIFSKRGEQNFAHEYLSASLLLSNFVSGTGELLSPTAAGYDENVKQLHLEKLVKTVLGFATNFHGS